MMRLPKFEYHVPQTIAEAVRIRGEAGPAGQFVAGGTDLYPNMKRRQQTPLSVISVMRLPELNQITGDGNSGLRIGASVTLTEICEHPIINRDYPVVAKAARTISTPLLRNMGTIGGNLLLDTRCNYYDQNYEWRKGINFCLKKDGDVCWVAPGSTKCWAVQSSDLVPVMVAIGAKIRLASTLGERVIDASLHRFRRVPAAPILRTQRPTDLEVRPSFGIPRSNAADERTGLTFHDRKQSKSSQRPMTDDAGHRSPRGEPRERLSVLRDKLRDSRIRVHCGECLEVVGS